MIKLAEIVNPASVPAPTLLTNIKPTTTATAPINPPNGAHQGIDVKPAPVGIGLGMHKNTQPSTEITGRKDTTLASQGLLNDFCSAPFMGGPQACRRPAAMIMG